MDGEWLEIGSMDFVWKWCLVVNPSPVKIITLGGCGDKIITLEGCGALLLCRINVMCVMDTIMRLACFD